MWILDELNKLKNSIQKAIITRFGECTFKELWEYSEKIAWKLNTIPKKTPIVIYGDKELEIFPVIIAALKTGRAYVPIDISSPEKRVKKIAKIVDACVIFNFSDKQIDFSYPIIGKDFLKNGFLQEHFYEEYPKENWVKDDDDCYIIFTSGSTGEPKGVPISKRNIVNLSKFSIFQPESTDSYATLNLALSFDASVPLIYIYLASGITLVCADKDLLHDIPNFCSFLSKYPVSIWKSTPSFLNLCLRQSDYFNHYILQYLRVFYLGGEVLNKNTARQLQIAFPNSRIINVCGPTEATVAFVACNVTKDMLEGDDSIPIGEVMEEAEYHILKDDGSECQKGEKGELVVISNSVARGYYNNPQKTRDSFYKANNGKMAYRTGDLVFEKDGLLYYAGRKDFQIKLSGYRIEIEDIEENILKIPFVTMCAVMPHYNIERDVDYLIANIVLSLDYSTKNKMKVIVELRRQLRGIIPSYMVPQKFLFYKELPLNVNGKVDRKKLETKIQREVE